MFCSKCGAEIMEEAAICPKCGCWVNNNQVKRKVSTGDKSGLRKAIKVFMIIGCVLTALYLIPLLWTIPMYKSYNEKLERKEPITTGFKVCTLLFVNTIAGILMLFDN